MSSEVLISIIVPNFNSERFIGSTIDSVLSQTYTNWELLIVDDKSSDQSKKVIEGYCDKDKRIKFIELPSNTGGPATPRNEGLRISCGEYICFLDSDDIWHPQKLMIQINYMREHNVAFSTTMRQVFCREDEISEDEILGKIFAKEVTYSRLLKKNFLVTSSAMILKELAIKYYFNTSKPYVAIEDYDYFLEMLKLTSRVHVINKKLVFYRITDQNISKNKIKMAKKVFNLLVEKLGPLKGFYYFLFYIFNSILYLYKAR